MPHPEPFRPLLAGERRAWPRVTVRRDLRVDQRHARLRAAVAALLCIIGGLLSRRLLRRRVRGLLKSLRPAPHWSYTTTGRVR